MSRKIPLSLLKENRLGFVLALIIGLLAYGVQQVTHTPFANPLVIALIFGIIIRAFLGEKSKTSLQLSLSLFIPIGILFYALKNLNFVKISKVDPGVIGLLFLVMCVYFGVIYLAGIFLHQKKKIIYLTATGSAICGASAIAITASAIHAKPNDISISLLAVAIASTFSLFLVFPLVATLVGLSDHTYALLCGSTLQFTGYVKIAVTHIPFLPKKLSPEEALSLAMSVKAVRYLGLLLAIPFFASVLQRKPYIPLVLWIYLGGGLCGSFIFIKAPSIYQNHLMPWVSPIYNLCWSVAMAAIGLNADIKQLLSHNGIKALIMAFTGVVAAIGIFFLGFAFLTHF